MWWLQSTRKRRAPLSESSTVRKKSYRILLYLSVATLFSAVALPAGLARERFHPKSERTLAHHSTLNSKKKAEVNIPISVQHGGSSDHDNPAAKRKTFRIVPQNNLRVLTTKPSTGPSVVGRNTIGLAVVRRQVLQPEDVMPLSHLQMPPPSGLPAGGLSSLGNRSVGTPQFTGPHMGTPPANSIGGGINGATLSRRPAAGVGGPSLAIGGINGTQFMLKH
jgi:hypothetical protein